MTEEPTDQASRQLQDLEQLEPAQLLEQLRELGPLTIGNRTPSTRELRERLAEGLGLVTLASNVVRVGPYRVRLAAPAKLSVRLDVLYGFNVNRQRATFAALGMAWKGAGTPQLSLKAHSYDVSEYGGAVADHLLAQGLHLREVQAATQVAYSLVVAGLAEYVIEIGEVVDFTERTPGAPDGRG